LTKGGAMTLTSIEQKVHNIKERIKLFRLTYPHIFVVKEKDPPKTIEQRLKRRTLRDLERERGQY
jgi:hypothetical protein